MNDEPMINTEEQENSGTEGERLQPRAQDEVQSLSDPGDIIINNS